VSGLTTNKTVRNSFVTDEEVLHGEIFYPENRIPLSLDKQKRWEIINKIQNNELLDEKETRKERIERNRDLKKKKFHIDLENQKQKQEKRGIQIEEENKEIVTDHEPSIKQIQEKSIQRGYLRVNHRQTNHERLGAVQTS
jgi:hypothetical protein